MTIRAATPADARAIAEVHVASWRVGYRGLVSQQKLDRLDVDEREQRWQEWIDDAIVLVAEDAGEVIAFVACRADSGEIAALYVTPARFRQGIGSRLLAAAHEALRERGRTEATLWVFADNHAARAFYATHGYAPDGASGNQLGLDTLRLSVPLVSSQQRLSPG